MGFFSGSKKIYVSAAAYNLAGDEATRTDTLGTMIVGSSVANKPFSDALVDSIFTGQAANLKAFARWSKASGFMDLLGLDTSSLSTSATVPPNVIIPFLPASSQGTVTVQSIKIDIADYTYFTDLWILANYPDRIDTEYTTDLVDATNQVEITWEDQTTSLIYITNYDSNASYIYCDYTVNVGGEDVVHGYIYKEGSGNATLDAYFVSVGSAGSYYPPIPLRLDNRFISSTAYPDLRTPINNACRKALNTSSSKLINMLDENESIGDIDYAYVMFGAALNSKDSGNKRYMYEFFNMLFLDEPVSGMGSFGQWMVDWGSARASSEAYNEWLNTIWEDPFPPVPPRRATFPSIPLRSVRINNKGRAEINVDITVSWNGIQKSQGSGRCKPGAKVGDVFVDYGGSLSFKRYARTQTSADDYDQAVPLIEVPAHDVDVVNIYYQTTRRSYVIITVYGLKHRNMIYGGKSVDISAKEALEDSDESGFIVPLHEDVFRQLPLIQANQCAASCNYLVLNCYQVVKQKWYQTGFFRIIVVIVAIVISVYSGGTGAGASAGLLGTNAAVGAALGVAAGTVAATIVGAIANAIASMIVGQLIMAGSTALFGEKLGAIFGAVATLLASNIQAINSGSSISEGLQSLFSADNWLEISSSVSKGISGYMAGEAQEIQNATQALMVSYNQDMQRVNAAMDSLGYSGIDPNVWAQSLETSQQFISRTLLTGMDIAAITTGMISSYVDTSLSTELG